MSETVTTFALGSAHSRAGTPRSIRAFGELVVGGGGVYLFQKLGKAEGSAIRIRPATDAQALMSGLALADTEIPLDGAAAELATLLRASDPEIELTQGWFLACRSGLWNPGQRGHHRDRPRTHNQGRRLQEHRLDSPCRGRSLSIPPVSPRR